MPRRIITSIAALACLSLAPMGAATAAEPDPAPSSATTVPGISEQVASQTEGVLHLTVADDFAGKKSSTTAVVTTAHGTISVPSSLVDSLRSGDAVTVARSAVGKVLSIEKAASEGASTDAPADAGIPSAGTHNVWYVNVSWSGAASPAVPANVQPSLTSYYSTISASSKGARVKVVSKGSLGAVSIDTPSSAGTECGAPDIYTAVAKKLGSKLPPASRFNHVVLVLPERSACWWAGLASIGPATDGRSHIWLNGAASLTPRVIDHEFGHNLGLRHSDLWQNAAGCPISSAKQALGSACYNAYGDPWDVMGGMAYSPDENTVGHMSAANLNRIGMLSSAEQYTVHATATPSIRIAPVTAGTGRRLVTIPYGRNVYTLEYRYNTPGTLDAWLSPELTGVVLRLRDESIGNDLTIAQLTNNTTFSIGGLTITATGLSATGADVKIARAADKTRPVLGQYGYWDDAYQYEHIGVVVKSTTLSTAYASAGDADSGIASVTLVVDGKARARSASTGLTRLYATHLSQGAHKWRLVVTDTFGNTLTGPYNAFRVDVGKPSITSSPRAWLAKGTVSTKSIPATVRWSAKDGCGIVWNSVAGSNGLSKTYYGKPKAISTRVKLGKNQFKVRVADCAANTKLATGPVTTASLDKQSKRKGYHGTWKATKYSKALGGTEQVTKKKKASVSHKVKARSIGWVATTGKDRGKAAVYIDGKKVAVVNLHASKTHYAQQVFTKTFSKSGTHTIKIVNLSTKKVGVDGFTRLS